MQAYFWKDIKMADETKTVPVYNIHDGLTGRDGGPYLDEEERRLAEIRRARVEGREPDLDNPPATAGTPLVNASVLRHTQDVNFAPSQGGVNQNPQLLVDGYANNSDVLMEQRGEAVVNSKAPTYYPASYQVSTDRDESDDSANAGNVQQSGSTDDVQNFEQKSVRKGTDK